MANAVYPFAKAQLARKVIDWVNDTVTAYLVDTADYTYSSSHKWLSDLTVAGRVDSASVTSKTVSDAGVLDCADFTFAAATGDISEAIVFVRNGGTEGSSELLFYFDTGVTGLPVTPNGGDLNVTINASGLVQL